MCLEVKYIPSNKREGLVQKSRKNLEHKWDYINTCHMENEYITPYRRTPVSKSGWIFNTNMINRVNFNDSLGSGVVHAYFNIDNSLLGFPAYSVCVCAFSQLIYSEIGSFAIFIPKVCENENIRNRTVNILDSINTEDSLTVSINKLKKIRKLELYKRLDFYKDKFRII